MSVPPTIDLPTAGPPVAPAAPARAPADPTAADPFFYGWRYTRRPLPNCMYQTVQVPLTEWDVLHPQEDDHIMQTPAHHRNCLYLVGAMGDTFADRRDVAVFGDERVDWEVLGIIPHGPDVVVFDGLKSAWDPDRGTFLVKKMGARPLLVIEVTSPSTRDKDLNEKVVEYHQAGVPFYLIIDRHETEAGVTTDVIGYRTTPEGYARVPADPDRGVWIPAVRTWFRVEGGWAQCLTADGARIPERADLTAKLRELEQNVEDERRRTVEQTARADAERERADAERERADAEKRRADQSDKRADDLERQLLALRAQVAQEPPAP